MNQSSAVELLSRYLEGLNKGGEEGALPPAVSATYGPCLESLISLAQQLRQALAPAQPSPWFEARLREKLWRAAGQRALQSYPQATVSHWPWASRGVIVGAVALGTLASLVAAVTILRARHQSAMKQKVA